MSKVLINLLRMFYNFEIFNDQKIVMEQSMEEWIKNILETKEPSVNVYTDDLNIQNIVKDGYRENYFTILSELINTKNVYHICIFTYVLNDIISQFSNIDKFADDIIHMIDRKLLCCCNTEKDLTAYSNISLKLLITVANEIQSTSHMDNTLFDKLIAFYTDWDTNYDTIKAFTNNKNLKNLFVKAKDVELGLCDTIDLEFILNNISTYMDHIKNKLYQIKFLDTLFKVHAHICFNLNDQTFQSIMSKLAHHISFNQDATVRKESQKIFETFIQEIPSNNNESPMFFITFMQNDKTLTDSIQAYLLTKIRFHPNQTVSDDMIEVCLKFWIDTFPKSLYESDLSFYELATFAQNLNKHCHSIPSLLNYLRYLLLLMIGKYPLGNNNQTIMLLTVIYDKIIPYFRQNLQRFIQLTNVIKNGDDEKQSENDWCTNEIKYEKDIYINNIYLFLSLIDRIQELSNNIMLNKK